MHQKYALRSLVWLALAALPGAPAMAGPFSCWEYRTIEQEMEDARAVVLLAPVAMQPVGRKLPDAKDHPPMAFFQVVEVLKGEEMIRQGAVIKAPRPGPARGWFESEAYFARLNAEGDIEATPWPVGRQGRRYVTRLANPPVGFDKAKFVASFLESAELIIRDDVVEELEAFDRATLQRAATAVDREALWRTIDEREVSLQRRRVAMKLLGMKRPHRREDTAGLAEIILSSDPQRKRGIDAAFIAHIEIAGEEGVRMIEEHFFKNACGDYADIYSGVTAIRWHLDQRSDAVPRERLLAALRVMLDRTDLADLVMIDLAREEDWSVVDRVVELFKLGDTQQTSWLRVPAIRYLMRCPLPEAKVHLRELKEIDPETYQRATRFFDDPPVADFNGAQ